MKKVEKINSINSMIDDMKSIMGFMRCSGVNYIYLPETGKLLFVPAESPKS